jgi:hypothetical protein
MPRTRSSSFQRHAIGPTVTSVSTADSASHHGSASRMMSSVRPMSIFATM